MGQAWVINHTELKLTALSSFLLWTWNTFLREGCSVSANDSDSSMHSTVRTNFFFRFCLCLDCFLFCSIAILLYGRNHVQLSYLAPAQAPARVRAAPRADTASRWETRASSAWEWTGRAPSTTRQRRPSRRTVPHSTCQRRRYASFDTHTKFRWIWKKSMYTFFKNRRTTEKTIPSPTTFFNLSFSHTCQVKITAQTGQLRLVREITRKHKV